MTSARHIVVDTIHGVLRCTGPGCNAEQPYQWPMLVKDFNGLCAAFIRIHQSCAEVGTEIGAEKHGGAR